MEALPSIGEFCNLTQSVQEILNYKNISLSKAESKQDFSLVHSLSLGHILSEKLAKKLEEIDIVQKAIKMCNSNEEV